MGLIDIIKGHLNEALGNYKDLADERMEICEQCPLFSKKPHGLICNSDLWLNPETNEVSTNYKAGFYNGCACRLKAKTTLKTEHCPAGKW